MNSHSNVSETNLTASVVHNRRRSWLYLSILSVIFVVVAACGSNSPDSGLGAAAESAATSTPIPAEDSLASGSDGDVHDHEDDDHGTLLQEILDVIFRLQTTIDGEGMVYIRTRCWVPIDYGLMSLVDP
jgi:hypothetical protein